MYLYCSLLKINERTKSKYHVYIDEMTKIVQVVGWLIYGVYRHFQQYFSYIVATNMVEDKREHVIEILNINCFQHSMVLHIDFHQLSIE